MTPKQGYIISHCRKNRRKLGMHCMHRLLRKLESKVGGRQRRDSQTVHKDNETDATSVTADEQRERQVVSSSVRVALRLKFRTLGPFN